MTLKPWFHSPVIVLALLGGACSSPSSSPGSTGLGGALGGAAGETARETGGATLGRICTPASGCSSGSAPHLRPATDGGALDATVSDAPSFADAAEDTGPAPDAGDAAAGGFWQTLAVPPPFIPDAPLVLTDGSILFHALDDASTWWRLTPDLADSYVNGSWSQLSPMPSGYEPLFFASAVLPDGSVIVVGGEYNRDSLIETAQGAIYDPVANQWTPVEVPWPVVGDAPSVVLPNGVFMMGSSETTDQALFDARTLTWTLTGNGKADANAEEGWTLLPNGKVLTVDVESGTNSELFNPATGSWSSAGSTGQPLADSAVFEIGPAILMPNGAVFAMGATPHTAVYQPNGTWTAGPDFPIVAGEQLDIADGPAVLLPNGRVLCVASPLDYQFGASFLEFDGATLNSVPKPPNAPEDSSFNIYLSLLPTGQVVAVDGSSDIEVYTPSGAADASWAPTITSVAATLTRGSTNAIEGTQFNGLSQAVSYGDDYQSATNYPLVRITNDATGHVFYARTHNHSTMAVATGNQIVSTLFDVSSTVEMGASHLFVIANGIASSPVSVTIQ